MRLITLAADAGMPEAQVYIGDTVMKSQVEEKLQAAREWYEKAAEGGHAGAKEKLAELADQAMAALLAEEEVAEAEAAAKKSKAKTKKGKAKAKPDAPRPSREPPPDAPPARLPDGGLECRGRGALRRDRHRR